MQTYLTADELATHAPHLPATPGDRPTTLERAARQGVAP